MMWAAGGLVVVSLLALLAFGTRQRGQYASPNLHEGRWGWPQMTGCGRQSRVSWELEAGHPICVGSNHAAVRCTIGPGMAHLDECVCGATRAGVYGEWLR